MDASVVASWAGAFVSLLGVVVSVWWPWRNRPQADWFFSDYGGGDDVLLVHGLADWSAHDRPGRPDRVVALLNDGDGAAFNVRVTVEGGGAYLLDADDDGVARVVRELPTVHVVEAGRTVVMAVYEDDPDLVVLTVHWTLQPTRLRQAVYRRIALRGRIGNQPWKPIPEDPDRGANLTWYLLTHPDEPSSKAVWSRRAVRLARSVWSLACTAPRRAFSLARSAWRRVGVALFSRRAGRGR